MNTVSLYYNCVEERNDGVQCPIRNSESPK